MTQEAPPPLRTGWEPLPAEPLPRPTCAPLALALGTTLVFWGLVTSWLISTTGLAVCAGALASWINAIRHARKQHP
jgi:hypothetical protein